MPGLPFQRENRAGLGLLLGLALSLAFPACGERSESIFDESLGLNGSFEFVESGIPVNWAVYTPRTVRTGDFDLVVDQEDAVEGQQCLKFVVRACSPDGGERSPGLATEQPASAGTTYAIGFWVKNDGAEFLVRAGGVGAFDDDVQTLIRSSHPTPVWKQYVYRYKMPAGFERIRFVLNVVSPGTFWVDDVTIWDVKEVW